MRSFISFIALLIHVTCSTHNKQYSTSKGHLNITEIRHKDDTNNTLQTNEFRGTEIHHKRGKNQNRKGSNDKSTLVKYKVEKLEKVEKVEKVEKIEKVEKNR